MNKITKIVLIVAAVAIVVITSLGIYYYGQYKKADNAMKVMSNDLEAGLELCDEISSNIMQDECYGAYLASKMGQISEKYADNPNNLTELDELSQTADTICPMMNRKAVQERCLMNTIFFDIERKARSMDEIKELLNKSSNYTLQVGRSCGQTISCDEGYEYTADVQYKNSPFKIFVFDEEGNYKDTWPKCEPANPNLLFKKGTMRTKSVNGLQYSFSVEDVSQDFCKIRTSALTGSYEEVELNRGKVGNLMDFQINVTDASPDDQFCGFEIIGDVQECKWAEQTAVASGLGSLFS